MRQQIAPTFVLNEPGIDQYNLSDIVSFFQCFNAAPGVHVAINRLHRPSLEFLIVVKTDRGNWK
jgi:hypothetical protein